MALWTLKRMDMIAVQGSKIETAMPFKKMIVIYVSVIGLAQVQQFWNIKKIDRFFKGIDKSFEHDIAVGENSEQEISKL